MLESSKANGNGFRGDGDGNGNGNGTTRRAVQVMAVWHWRVGPRISDPRVSMYGAWCHSGLVWSAQAGPE